MDETLFDTIIGHGRLKQNWLVSSMKTAFLMP